MYVGDNDMVPTVNAVLGVLAYKLEMPTYKLSPTEAEVTRTLSLMKRVDDALSTKMSKTQRPSGLSLKSTRSTTAHSHVDLLPKSLTLSLLSSRCLAYVL